MASVSKRTNKGGKTVYRIRVSAGRRADGKQRNSFQTTWKPDPDKSETANLKALNAFVVKFEQECRDGFVSCDKSRFEEYARYIVELKRKNGVLKISTSERYLEHLRHIEEICNMRLSDITSGILTSLYNRLLETPAFNSIRYRLKEGICLMEMSQSLSKAECAEKYGMSVSTLKLIMKRNNVSEKTAKSLSDGAGVSMDTLFDVIDTGRKLCAATVRDIHSFISMVLGEAVMDGIIKNNPAACARLPKTDAREAEFLSPEELKNLLHTADSEPSNIRLFIYMLAASGGRRGEVAGLRWQDVDFEYGQIHFSQTLLYRKNIGIYIDTPKNKSSDRFLKLPREIMQMLCDYHEEQKKVISSAGKKYPVKITLPDGKGQPRQLEADFVFTQKRRRGYPIHPNTVNTWLKRLSETEREKLLHPHIFRHTAASLLIFAGIDSVSVANYLGHASPATTQNIYSHALQEARIRTSSAVGRALFSPINICS